MPMAPLLGARLLSVLLCAALASVLAGCDPDASPPGDVSDATVPPDGRPADAGDAAGGDSAGRPEVIVGPVCTSGTPQSCTEDLRRLVQCNADGTGYEEIVCAAQTGDSACLSAPTPHCSACAPGRRACEDDDVVLACREDGTAYEPYDNCHGADTGRVCQSGTCLRLCDLAIKENSYMGCEYWGADLDNAFVSGGRSGYYDAQGAPYAIVVSNPHPRYPATVQIFQWNATLAAEELVTRNRTGGLLDLSPVPPGGLRTFYLPRRDIDGTTITPRAYRVVASIPITAYQFNPLDNVNVYSNDASLLLPVNVLGKYYIVMTREQSFEQLRSYATVIAVQPGETTVTMTVTAPTLVGEAEGRPQAEREIPHLEPGDSITRVLTQYEVFSIETDEIGADMTGTVVLANRNVAVFGGSEASNAPNTNHCEANPSGLGGIGGRPEKVCAWDGETPCETHADCSAFITCCADHLEEQLLPVKSWGESFIATKSYDRGLEKDVWRVLAAQDNTRVTTLPQQVAIPVLHKGEWFDFESREHFEIRSQGPIQVGQFLAAEQAPDPNVMGSQPGDAGTGDPAFILAVPHEQYRKEYVFLAPDKYAFDYVNIIVPTGADVLLDGAYVPVPEFDLVGTGDYSVARLAIADGVHDVYADVPVGVIVYGYDQYVSYGYPAGLDLKQLNELPEEEEDAAP